MQNGATADYRIGLPGAPWSLEVTVHRVQSSEELKDLGDSRVQGFKVRAVSSFYVLCSRNYPNSTPQIRSSCGETYFHAILHVGVRNSNNIIARTIDDDR
jgi:hypothetical protein